MQLRLFSFPLFPQRLFRRRLGKACEAPPLHHGQLTADEGFQVHTGTERPAGAGDNGDPDIVVAIQFIHGGCDTLGHGPVSSIFGLRAVQGDGHDAVGYVYYESEATGLFWSNDPALPISSMLGELGLMEMAPYVERNRRAQDEARGGAPSPPGCGEGSREWLK